MMNTRQQVDKIIELTGALAAKEAEVARHQAHTAAMVEQTDRSIAEHVRQMGKLARQLDEAKAALTEARNVPRLIAARAAQFRDWSLAEDPQDRSGRAEVWDSARKLAEEYTTTAARPTPPGQFDMHLADLAREAVALARIGSSEGQPLLMRALEKMRDAVRAEGGDDSLRRVMPYVRWALGPTDPSQEES